MQARVGGHRLIPFLALVSACDLLTRPLDGDGLDAADVVGAEVSEADGAPSDGVDVASDATAVFETIVPDTDFGVPEEGSGEVADGEAHAIGPVTIRAPAGTLSRPVAIEAAVSPLPEALPAGFVLVGHNVDVRVSDPDAIVAALEVELRYDPAAVPEGWQVAVSHWEPEQGYALATVLAVDAERGVVTLATRSFSQIGAIAIAPDPRTDFRTGFIPSVDGWPIGNYGGFGFDGHCLGMAAFAGWYFMRDDNTPLVQRFTGADANVRYGLLAARAHATMNAILRRFPGQDVSEGPGAFVDGLKANLRALGPTVVYFTGTTNYDGGVATSGSHAVLVTGYDAQKFFVYDPNLPSVELHFDYDEVNGPGLALFDGADPVFLFGAIPSATASGRLVRQFRFATLASITRLEDLKGLLREADEGFEDSADIDVIRPFADTPNEYRVLEITGSISGQFQSGARLWVLDNGLVFPLITSFDTNFNGLIPAFAGLQRLYIVATVGYDNADWSKLTGAITVREVENTLPPTELMVIAQWDRIETDLDLVYLAPNGIGVWKGERYISDLATMELTDEWGTGAEYIYVSEATGHLIVDEDRRIRLHFVDDSRFFDPDDPAAEPLPRVTATVTIILGDGTAERRVVQCTRLMPFVNDPFETNPNGTGPSWVDIADVNLAAKSVVALPGATCAP